MMVMRTPGCPAHGAGPVSSPKLRVLLSAVLNDGGHGVGSRGPEGVETWHRKEMWGLSQEKTYRKVLYWVELRPRQIPHLKKLCLTLGPMNMTLFGNRIFAGVIKDLQMRSI